MTHARREGRLIFASHEAPGTRRGFEGGSRTGTRQTVEHLLFRVLGDLPITDPWEESGGSRVEYRDAEPFQPFSGERGGYPSVRVALVARVDRYLSYLRADEILS